MQLVCEGDRLLAVPSLADDLEARIDGENRLESLSEETVVVCNQDADPSPVRCVGVPSHSRNLPCYARFVKSDDARARIQKLLVTGDNRLKQGAGHAKARESYERALAIAIDAGLEETVRPLVEIRLADLERLEGRPAPGARPDA
jgi:hypothetical protein